MKIFSMFDGVGGFIVGLNNSDSDFFNTIYSNQFEPSRKTQDAFEVGVYRFPGMEHINTDVGLIPNTKFDEMREAGVEMIVGASHAKIIRLQEVRNMNLGFKEKRVLFFGKL
ncbi:Modification methylase Sau3AI [Listeria rocourtiae FSL F6-920]|nr:Modification methylase Sau3AI [Listeria rocourtiae FSL F6-920]